NWRQIHQAIADVRGKLLETWDGASIAGDSPTLRVVLKAAELVESWCGSAGELLNRLIHVDHLHSLGFGDELPTNEDAMGIWLRDNYGALRANGIRVWRPRRHRQKRLWAWRKVTTEGDTRDASADHVSLDVTRRNQNADNKQCPTDTRDAWTEEQLLLQNIVNTGGTP